MAAPPVGSAIALRAKGVYLAKRPPSLPLALLQLLVLSRAWQKRLHFFRQLSLKKQVFASQFQ